MKINYPKVPATITADRPARLMAKKPWPEMGEKYLSADIL